MKSSIQTNIIRFFFFITFLVISFTLIYISYGYHKQLEQDVKGALSLMLFDIKRDHLELNLHQEELGLFSQEVKKSSFGELFGDLKIDIIKGSLIEDESRIGTYDRLDETSYLYLSCSRKLLNEKVLLFTLETFSLFMLIFIVLFTVFVFYVKGQFRWLHCLIDFCNSYASDRSSYLKCNGTYESTNLHMAILSLIQSNDSLCIQKQELFKEAAHELKSPIAVLKARLSLFEKDETIDKQEFVSQSKDDISRIVSKLKELLFLKSIEWDMQLKREDVNMEDNCMMMQKAFSPILEKKGVKVESQWEENFIICTYKDALQKVLQAIFENIFIHTKKNSTIYVQAKPNEMYIKNEIGEGEDIPLFSSYIGTKMIERLSQKLSYEYIISSDEKFFYTRLIFYSIEDEGCAI